MKSKNIALNGVKEKENKIYLIGLPGELKEAHWLISEGDFSSLEDYIREMTHLFYGYRPKLESIKKITWYSDL